jgi:hypothetical protein
VGQLRRAPLVDADALGERRHCLCAVTRTQHQPQPRLTQGAERFRDFGQRLVGELEACDDAVIHSKEDGESVCPPP